MKKNIFIAILSVVFGLLAIGAIFLFLILIFFPAPRQIVKKGEKLFKEGVAYHEKADYKMAIEKYSEAIDTLHNNLRVPTVHNNLAWVYATCPDERYRNGDLAIKHAKKACFPMGLKDADNSAFLDTLAAAYAEKGEFSKAIGYMTKAIRLADESDKEKRKEEYKARLKLYKSGVPYREDPGGTTFNH